MDDTGYTSDTVRFVPVSGFLGAGKTTALRALGRALRDRGDRVGAITNDQAAGLVDTAVLDADEGPVEEIPGGCFCCNFPALVDAGRAVRDRDVDAVLCEPVGSCTDLVATVLNPLRLKHAEAFSVAPLTVVLDPERVRSYLAGAGGSDDGLPPEVRYIFRQQVAEADVVVLTKTDTLDEGETSRLVGELEARVGDRPVVPVSATREEGIDEWLSHLDDEVVGGRALDDIDYDTYAAGEARLGWVNATVDVEGPVDADALQRGVVDRLRPGLADAGIEVAHLKFSVAADGRLAHAHLTSTGGDPAFDGAALGVVDGADLLVNARAVGDPETVRRLAVGAVEETAVELGATATVGDVEAFRPEYPEPVHRVAEAGD